MKPRIDLITIVTANFATMRAFYRDVIGYEILLDLDSYVEFKNEGVRFAICTADVMHQATGHKSFTTARVGQSLELAFPLENPAEVEAAYVDLVSKGAEPVRPPEKMPWNQVAAFFADPDGNIHELFCDLPGEEE